MMKVALDTNCFIDAADRKGHAHEVLQEILKASYSGKLTLMISRHSLHELEIRQDGALALAKSISALPHFPVGIWGDQVGTWSQVAGTWEDAKRNEGIQQDLKKLAQAGADIRDRGTYLILMPYVPKPMCLLHRIWPLLEKDFPIELRQSMDSG